jgi:hypothetical protein
MAKKVPSLKRKKEGFMKRVLVLSLLFLFVGFTGAFAQGYDKLCEYLIDLDGWKGEKCTSMQMSMGSGMHNLSVLRSYSQGDKSLDALILAGTMAQTYQPARLPEMEFSVGNEKKIFAKTFEVNGYKVMVAYDSSVDEGTIMILLNGSFNSYSGNTAVFALNFHGMSWQKALEIAKKFDWDAMKRATK